MAEKRATKKSKVRAIRRTSAVTVKPVGAVKEKTNNLLFSKIKKINLKILSVIIIVVVVCVLYLLKGLFIAAIVNGTPISRFTVTSELEQKDGKQVLSNLVAQTLIEQEARRRHVSVSQKEVDDSVKTIEANLASQGQTLDEALATQGMTRADFMEQLKIQDLIEKMFSKEVKVTDKEVTDYIEQNKASIPSDLTGNNLNNSVRQQLLQQKLSTVFQDWLTDAQKNAKIMYFVNFQ